MEMQRITKSETVSLNQSEFEESKKDHTPSKEAKQRKGLCISEVGMSSYRGCVLITLCVFIMLWACPDHIVGVSWSHCGRVLITLWAGPFSCTSCSHTTGGLQRACA